MTSAEETDFEYQDEDGAGSATVSDAAAATHSFLRRQLPGIHQQQQQTSNIIEAGAGAPAAAAATPVEPASVEHENLVQRNLRNKVCAYCRRPGARKKCEGCKQRRYCDNKCQKKDWKKEHRGQCKKLQQEFMPPPPGWGGAATGVGGGSCGAAAAAGGGEASSGDPESDSSDEYENPCPLCLDNEDDATIDGIYAGFCWACGQQYCGACNSTKMVAQIDKCPTCRAPYDVSDVTDFENCRKLVHDRPSGRHTRVAQYNLGLAYAQGLGVRQNHADAAKYTKLSADQGYPKAQHNLGNSYRQGVGVPQDDAKAVKYFKLAADQGHGLAAFNLGSSYCHGIGVAQNLAAASRWYQIAAAQCKKVAVIDPGAAAARAMPMAIAALNGMQEHNLIPTPPAGTAVTTVLLTSATGLQYNNRSGSVVAPTSDIQPGRVAVLLDGEPNPISFKLKNVQAMF